MLVNLSHIDYMRMKQEEIVKKAEQRRLIRELGAKQPSIPLLVLNQLGAILINLGQRLQKESSAPCLDLQENNI